MDLDGPLGTHGLGDLKGIAIGVLGVEGELRDALAVTKVAEDKAAVVAATAHPTGEGDLFAHVSKRSSPQVRVCMECSSMGRVWLIPVILLYGSVPPRVVPGGVVQICPACVNRAARHGVLSYRTCVDVPRKSSSCPKT